jgi:flagellar motor component MotA
MLSIICKGTVMSNILGWVISVLVIYMACVLWGNLGMYFDPQTVVVVLGFTYGLSVVSFGLKATMNSINSFKYILLNPQKDSKELSHIYKTQMKLSFIAGGISTLLGLIALGSNLSDLRSLGPALSIICISLLYPLLVSGLVYYPLYKKLA